MNFFQKRLVPSLFLIISVFLLPHPAHALILQAEENLFFNDYVTEDVYLAGENVTIQEDVAGDVWVAGQTVTINSKIEGDLVVVGANVLLNGEVTDDVRLIGSTLLVNGTVGGDVIAIGGSVDVTEQVAIAGDMLVIAAITDFYGTVNKSVHAFVNELNLGGTIQGDVNVRAYEKVVLLNSGHVVGNVAYFGPQKMIDQGGQVEGEISFNAITGGTDIIKQRFGLLLDRVYVVSELWRSLSFLLIGALLLLLFPHLFSRVSEKIREQWASCFGMGFLLLLAGGIVSLIALFTIVGIKLSFMLMAILFVVSEVGRVMGTYWLGNVLLRRDRKKGAGFKNTSFGSRFLSLFVGLVLLKLMGFIPGFGWILGSLTFFLGLGGLILVQRSNYQHLVKERLV